MLLLAASGPSTIRSVKPQGSVPPPSSPLGKTPLQFVENRGQWDAHAQFLVRAGGLDLWVTDDGMAYDIHRYVRDGKSRNPHATRINPHATQKGSEPGHMEGHVIRMRFEGASRGDFSGSGQQEARYSFFKGKDANRWVTGVHGFAEVRAQRIYPGISARYYIDQGSPRYDLIVAPGADLSKVAMRFEGANGLELAADGGLSIKTSMGVLSQRGLFAYQARSFGISPVACQMVVEGTRVRFKLGNYDHSQPLVIDPLVWCSYLGGSPYQGGQIAWDPSGNLAVAGYAYSTGFPTTTGAYQTQGDGLTDAFVAKFSSDGSHLLCCTYLGGSGSDHTEALAVDGSGNVVIVGVTSSSDFPVTSGDLRNYSAYDDAFFAKISSDGSTLLYGGYLGGSGTDSISSVALDASGGLYVSGETQSNNFPVSGGCFQSRNLGYDNGFLAHISADGTRLLASTLFGGSNEDYLSAVSLDSFGNPVVAGSSGSTDLATTSNGFQRTLLGFRNGIVAKFSADLTQLLYSTYFGGGGDGCWFGSMVLDASDNAVVAGGTDSTLPVTAGVFQTQSGGGSDGFVASLSLSGPTLGFATYLGGHHSDTVNCISFDLSGNLLLGGWTGSSDLPITGNAYQSQGIGTVGFFARMARNGSALYYCSKFGGGNFDDIESCLVDDKGSYYIAGSTSSADLPVTAGAFQTTYYGTTDLFLAKLTEFGLKSLSLSRSVVSNGLTDPCTVNLTNPVFGPGATITLTSSNPAVAAVPATVPVPVGKPSVTFPIRTVASSTNQVAVITATAGGTSVSISLTVGPLRLYSVILTEQTLAYGATGHGQVLLSGAAPSGGVVVPLSCGETTVKLPSQVPVGGGGGSATFTYTTSYTGVAKSVPIFANFGGVTKSRNVILTPPVIAPAPDSFGVYPATPLTVAAPGVLANDANAQFGTAAADAAPAHAAAFALNADGSFSYTAANGFVGTDTFNYHIAAASGNSASATVSIVVSPPPVSVASVSFDNPSPGGGQSVVVTATLSGPAVPEGTIVTVGTDLPGASFVNPTVTVPGGQATAVFTLRTAPTLADAPGHVTATAYGFGTTVPLTVLGPSLASFTVASTTVQGGVPFTATIGLTGMAPPGLAIPVTYSAHTSGLATITVPEKGSSVAFSISTTKPSTIVGETISVTYRGVTKSIALSIRNGLPAPAALTLNPNPIWVTYDGTATLTLDGPAPIGGASVSFVSSAPSILSVPATVAVPAGRTSVSVPIHALATLVAKTVGITASYNGVSQSGATLVNPITFSSFFVAPGSVSGGDSATGFIYLSHPVGARVLSIALRSSSPYVQVPGSVSVWPGQSVASFSILTIAPGTSPLAVSLTATALAVSKVASLTLK